MKKLISILLMLLMLSCMALAEDAAPAETPAPEATVVETSAPDAQSEIAMLQAEIAALKARLDEIAPTAEPAVEPAQTKVLEDADMLPNGLIVTAGGLGGVFLVLILFFLMIKVMHKLLK